MHETSEPRKISIDEAKALRPHPLSKLFPAYTAEELTTLTDSIQTHGQRELITLIGADLRLYRQ